MTLLRPLFLVPILCLCLAGLGARADHERPVRSVGPAGRVLTPLDAMPPGMAAAYQVAIQRELAAHGYDPGPADGLPGPRTTRAIRAYQRDAGLPADGVASKELLDHLKFVLPKVYARHAPREPLPPPRVVPWSPVPQNTPEPGVTEHSPRPGEEGGTDSPTRLWPLAEDQQGGLTEPAPGGAVTLVQDALRRRGYYDGPVDGSFGAETGAAIRRFQRDWGMAETGVIDAPLLAVLLPPKATAYDL